ncbi:MAG: TIGR03915 family putative DNA repair protein [Oscillospiraceae bacterium]
MYNRTDVVYIYDGSFDGFLCCVFNYYYSALNPVDIMSEADFEPTLYQAVTIETDSEQAKRVSEAIVQKLSLFCYEFLQYSMLTCLYKKEMYMLRYVIKGFKAGAKIHNMVSDEDVNVLTGADRHMRRESHMYLGLARFYQAQDVYVASIKPQNQILSLISAHFVQRFAKQSFMIYDETHGQALIYANGKEKIIYTQDIELPTPSENEQEAQRMWKLFYDTISIKERYNPLCRMRFMPKRTWDKLPEMQNLCENSKIQLTK